MVDQSLEGEFGRSWSVAVLAATPQVGASTVTIAAGAMVDAAVGPVGQNVMLMDADLRTAGLTRLLHQWGSAMHYGGGLAGFAFDGAIPLDFRSLEPRLTPMRSPDGRKGEMLLLTQGTPGDPPLEELTNLPKIMGMAVQRLVELAGCLLVDCGSEWSEVTVEICRAVEFIAVVSEPGGLARPETRQLVDRLKEHGLIHNNLLLVENQPTPGGISGAQVEPGTTRNGTGPASTHGTTHPTPAEHALEQGLFASPHERTLIHLPYAPDTVAALYASELPALETPFGADLKRQMEALDPALFYSGFDHTT
ncbi:hypothetical protein [Streptomyces sp. NBC_00690]|uniref:hypothetical protein n=1 Tax=Streptomyces sp. NBC_00690 TaxID=2975808 RepID=UPI002E28DB65|nr:hypothetical protein [Streptomyces sp. NBC_00690]